MIKDLLRNNSFYGLGIAPKMLELLEKMNFTTPTAIQYKAIPLFIEGKDLIGIAQTGTGKTLAFAVPTVQRLSQTKGGALIVTPTRELALQVNETFHKIAQPFGIGTAVLIGGASMSFQLEALKKSPRVFIATPGRLIDHIRQHSVKLSNVDMVILDEADRMLEMGFIADIKRILRELPKQRQTLLFSATISQEVVKIATAYMKLPIRIEVAPSGTTAEKIIQELF